LGSLKDSCDCFDVLFWSGGKDSFLCLSHLLENDKNIVLLTTFSVDTNRVPIQNIHIKDIVQQASFFNVPVCLVPIPQNSNYRDTVSAGLRAIEERVGANVTRICFGDLHLQDLLNWRVETWPQYEVFTPLFGRPYQELLELLWKSASQYDVSIHLSTEVQLPNAVLPIGTTYDKALVERLQRAGVDAMLEFGEGHTHVLPNCTMTNQSVSSQYKY
jgi:ATP-binding cassette subfamily B (MDR/TAP) protein 1